MVPLILGTPMYHCPFSSGPVQYGVLRRFGGLGFRVGVEFGPKP